MQLSTAPSRRSASRRWSPGATLRGQLSSGAARAVCLLAGLLWHLPGDICRVLVVAQALEPGVAELPVGGPFAEAHLGDQARLHPVHPGPGQLAAAERGAVLLQAGQRGMQAVQGLPGEAGADFAGVDELVTGVVAEVASEV
jgi:hypothetical protein